MRCSRIVVAIVLAAFAVVPARAALFGGERLVDRYQMARVVARVIHESGQFHESYALWTKELPDVHESWARPVAMAVHTGVMSGHEGKFDGKRPVTRYEMAAIFRRLLDRVGFTGQGERRHMDPTDLHHTDRSGEAARDAIFRDIMKPRSRSFGGAKYVVRYELAAIAARLGRHLGIAPTGDQPQVTDLPEDHWCRADAAYAMSVGLLHVEGVDGAPEFEAPAGSAHRGHAGYVERRRTTRQANPDGEDDLYRLHPWGGRDAYRRGIGADE